MTDLPRPGFRENDPAAWLYDHEALLYEAACRPDQTSRIEWEPPNGPRDENEDRVGGVLVCECSKEQP